MATTIYKFEQGRLLVHEERTLLTNYRDIQSGVPVRIGGVRTIEEVLSVTTDYERYGLVTVLEEVRTSGSEIFVVMRSMDVGPGTSGIALSGAAGTGLLSNITSGLGWLGELRSSSPISGLITVKANVIGF